MRRNQQRRISSFGAGVLVLALVGLATYFGFTKSVPFRDHFEVRAVFENANNLRPASPVRIAGVTVGEVSGVERVDGGRAVAVKLRIDEKGLPIREDAFARIRPRIFLEGNFFVDLQPGSPSADELEDGDTIPVNQTASPVQLDEVLTTLQADTRKQLQALLGELSTAVTGPGADGFRRSTRHWEAAYRDSAIVADAQQGERPGDLSGYLREAGAVAEALDRNPRQLKALITDFHATARAFATNDDQLQAALTELPRTLRTGHSALGRLNAAFPATRRLVRDLRPAVRSSEPALDAGTPFARELRGLVRRSELRGLVGDLRPAVPDLARLQEATVPLYEEVRAASGCQNSVILPWTKDKIEDKTFPTDLKVYEEATKPISGLAGESRSGDANGQWFRVLVGGPVFAYPLGTERFFLTQAPILGTNPPKPKARPPYRPDVPCETQEPPDLRTVPGPAPEGRRIKVSPRNQDRMQALVEKAARALRKDVKAKGLDLEVSTKPITEKALEALGR